MSTQIQNYFTYEAYKMIVKNLLFKIELQQIFNLEKSHEIQITQRDSSPLDTITINNKFIILDFIIGKTIVSEKISKDSIKYPFMLYKLIGDKTNEMRINYSKLLKNQEKEIDDKINILSHEILNTPNLRETIINVIKERSKLNSYNYVYTYFTVKTIDDRIILDMTTSGRHATEILSKQNIKSTITLNKILKEFINEERIDYSDIWEEF